MMQAFTVALALTLMAAAVSIFFIKQPPQRKLYMGLFVVVASLISAVGCMLVPRGETISYTYTVYNDSTTTITIVNGTAIPRYDFNPYVWLFVLPIVIGAAAALLYGTGYILETTKEVAEI